MQGPPKQPGNYSSKSEEVLIIEEDGLAALAVIQHMADGTFLFNAQLAHHAL